jgi:hypothetical protein
MRNLFLLLILSVSTSLAQDSTRVNIVQLDSFTGKLAGSSLGASIDHRHPGNITVFTSGSVYSSTDTGKTWKPTRLPDVPDAQDLQVSADPKGMLYYYYTGRDHDDKIYFSKSEDNGITWSDVASLHSGKGKDAFVSLGGHPRKDALIFTWTQTEDIEGLGCVSNLYAAISTSGGKKWREPILINGASGDCLGKGGMLQASSPMVGRDGKAFIIWSGKERLFIDRSYDGGDLWIRTDLPVAEQPGGWNLVIPDAPGTSNVPSVMIDNTEFRTVGMIYLAYADQKNGATDTDIWMLRSPNHGDNWTYPLRVNLDEPGKYQYSPRLAVDQATGFVYITYFDRRNYEDSRSDIYLAWSGDAGAKFQEMKINKTPISKGDAPALISIAAQKGIVEVLWTVSEAGQTTVNAATIRQLDLP